MENESKTVKGSGDQTLEERLKALANEVAEATKRAESAPPVEEQLPGKAEDANSLNQRAGEAREIIEGMGIEADFDGFNDLEEAEQEALLGTVESFVKSPNRQTILGLSGMALRQHQSRHGRLR